MQFSPCWFIVCCFVDSVVLGVLSLSYFLLLFIRFAILLFLFCCLLSLFVWRFLYMFCLCVCLLFIRVQICLSNAVFSLLVYCVLFCGFSCSWCFVSQLLLAVVYSVCCIIVLVLFFCCLGSFWRFLCMFCLCVCLLFIRVQICLSNAVFSLLVYCVLFCGSSCSWCFVSQLILAVVYSVCYILVLRFVFVCFCCVC